MVLTRTQKAQNNVLGRRMTVLTWNMENVVKIWQLGSTPLAWHCDFWVKTRDGGVVQMRSLP